MTPTVQFLTALGQALSALSLYGPAHPVRATARQRVRDALTGLHGDGLRLSFLDGEVIEGDSRVTSLRGWDWGARLAQAGVQRLEIDATPLPSDAALDQLIEELHGRIVGRHSSTTTAFACEGLRAGPLGVVDVSSDADVSLGATDLLDAIARDRLDEEAGAVRWIHDEAASGRAIPMAEVEAVIRSLAFAMHRDQHVVLPLLELKSFDQYTTTHSCNVAMLAMGLAEQLGLPSPDIREIGTAALLHDIGKVAVPQYILVKPGKLTEREFALMRRHPIEGARMLSQRGRGHALAAVVAYEHHVWEDGTRGYPQFQYVRRCHYASRLVHVCDLYDALSTRRPYREAWPRERTLRMLQEQAGSEVDAAMVQAFTDLAARAEESRLPLTEVPQNDWTASVARAARDISAGTHTAPAIGPSASRPARET